MHTSTDMLLHLRHTDYVRYLCALFAPAEKREGLATLYLFNHELSKIRDITSEPMTGLIRLQWWRDAIEEIYAGKAPRKHPIVDALAMIKDSLAKDLFLSVIDGREKDVEFTQPETVDALIEYVRGTNGNFMQLCAAYIGVENSGRIEKGAIAYGLAGLMISQAADLRQGICFFPVELMQPHDISMDDFGSRAFLDASIAMTKIVCEKANALLKEAQQHPKTSCTLLLQEAVATHWLRQMKKRNYDVLSTPVMPQRLSLLYRMVTQ